MRNSLTGLVMGIVILFLSLFVIPLYYIGCIQWRDDMNMVQNSTRNFIDKVIDTREMSEDTIADFNLALASCSSTFSYKVLHEEIVTNPNEGGTVTTWIYTDNLEDWNSGDLITVEVKQVSQNFFQRISSMMIGLVYANKSCTMCGMVR